MICEFRGGGMYSGHKLSNKVDGEMVEVGTKDQAVYFLTLFCFYSVLKKVNKDEARCVVRELLEWL